MSQLLDLRIGSTGSNGSTDSTGNGLKLLFIHQNFPSQYHNLAAYYAADPENTVVALGEGANLQVKARHPGVALVGYRAPQAVPKQTGPARRNVLARGFENSTRRGFEAAGALRALKESGFEPDLVLAHPDWGDAMFLRVIYPKVPLLAYAENYFSAWGPDLDFDPDAPANEAARCLAEALNATRALTLAEADWLTTPFEFQRSLLPPALRERTSLLHDGIDTDWFCPDPQAGVTITQSVAFTQLTSSRLNSATPPSVPSNKPTPSTPVTPLTQPSSLTFFTLDTPFTLTSQDEVFTYCARALEPHRGWPSFARALPEIQQRHPKAHCIIVGRTQAAYGPEPAGGGNWRDLLLEELRDHLDFTRLHFMGNVPQDVLRNVLAISRAHVYLTYPFFLSYSPLEAMSCGAPLVASDTAPLREVVKHRETALLVDFHSPGYIAAAVCRLLDDADLRASLGRAGREHIVAGYDWRRVWQPRWDALIRQLAGSKNPPLLPKDDCTDALIRNLAGRSNRNAKGKPVGRDALDQKLAGSKNSGGSL